MKKSTQKPGIIAAVIELVGVSAVATGLGIELALGADVGYMVITGGSLIVTAGGILYSKILKK